MFNKSQINYMKKLLLVSLLSLLAFSCSDKLTESKTEKLINECLEIDPLYGKGIIKTGKISFSSDEDKLKMEDLVKKGLIITEDKEDKGSLFNSKYTLVSLTDKAKPYILESKESYGGNTIHKVMLYSKKIDKIGSIQEIPSMNIAEVTVTFLKDNKTPFYDALEQDKTDFETKKISLKKTENKGWVYCEK